MARLLAGFIVAAFLFIPFLGAQAADLQLWVNNQEFSAPTVTRGSDVYAPVEAMLKALGYSWTVNGSTVVVTKAPGGGVSIAPTATALSVAATNGTAPLTVMNGQISVKVSAFAKIAGLSYHTSSALGTADLIAPVSKASVSQNWGKASGADASSDLASKDGKAAVKLNAQGLVETDGTNPASPINVLENPYSDTTVATASYVGEIRTGATIVNSGNKPVDNISISIDLVNGNGDSYHSWNGVVGTLAPGQKYVFNPEPPIFYNYNKITLFPKVIITHTPVKNDKK